MDSQLPIVRQCRRELVAVMRSYWLIPEILPLAARDDFALLYVFCRRLDDSVDEAPDMARAGEALAGWRDELAGRVAPRPLVAAFLASAARTGLPLECVTFLLEGMESDLGPVRFADDVALLRYSYRVSACVGLMLAPVFAMRGPQTERRVVDFCLALQISNILMGVRGDAARDRVYVPGTRLALAGLRPQDVLAAPASPRLLPVLQGLAALADRYYASAALGAAAVPLRYRHGVILFGRMYRELGWRAAFGAAPPSADEIPWRSKARHLAGLMLSAWHPRTLGIVSPRPHDPALHRAIAGWPGAAVTSDLHALHPV